MHNFWMLHISILCILDPATYFHPFAHSLMNQACHNSDGRGTKRFGTELDTMPTLKKVTAIGGATYANAL